MADNKQNKSHSTQWALDEASKPDESRADFSQINIGAYNPELNADAWRHKKALKDTPQGRAVIRMFSRGVMGTAMFTLGAHIANTQMRGYTPEAIIDIRKKPVQLIARFFDNVFGKPMKAAVDVLGRDGEKFVNNFRPTAQFDGYKTLGRSLGHEVMMVTFDFGAMSIGDFWGRKIMHTLDPNKKRPGWKREDGSINWAQALKTFGYNWWKAVTYAAGEDWAVAVPYCLAMRHIGTPVIDKFVPGYRFEFDRNGNGGGMLVDEHGKLTGNMTAGGVFNLWERFTTYNVGTLLFRESYNWTGGRIKHWWKTGHVPTLVEPNPMHPDCSTAQTAVDGVKQFTNWIVRGSIKAVTYMIPAVPFFWVTRTPQHKFQGAFIHPEKGAVMFGKGNGTLLRNNTPAKDYAGQPFFFSATRESVANPLCNGPILHNAKTWSWMDKALNPIAKLADKARGILREPIGKGINKVFGITGGKGFADTYINASMAYTPYFWAKSDWLADRLDTGWTDAALDRTLAGAAMLNSGEFKAGCGEVWQAIKHRPFKDPQRELYAQCREATDDTPSDNKFDINPNAGGSCEFLLPENIEKAKQALAKKESFQPASRSQQGLNWRDFVVKGKAEDKPEVGSDRPTGYAEKEEMRKLLEELHPPTNAIN